MVLSRLSALASVQLGCSPRLGRFDLSRLAGSRRPASLRLGLVLWPMATSLALASVHPGCSPRLGRFVLSRLAGSRRPASLRLGLVLWPMATSLALASVHPGCSQRLGRFDQKYFRMPSEAREASALMETVNLIPRLSEKLSSQSRNSSTSWLTSTPLMILVRLSMKTWVRS